MNNITFAIPKTQVQNFLTFLELNNYKHKRYYEGFQSSDSYILYEKIKVSIPYWMACSDSYKKIRSSFSIYLIYNVCFDCRDGYMGKSPYCKYCSIQTQINWRKNA